MFVQDVDPAEHITNVIPKKSVRKASFELQLLKTTEWIFFFLNTFRNASIQFTDGICLWEVLDFGLDYARKIHTGYIWYMLLKNQTRIGLWVGCGLEVPYMSHGTCLWKELDFGLDVGRKVHSGYRWYMLKGRIEFWVEYGLQFKLQIQSIVKKNQISLPYL